MNGYLIGCISRVSLFVCFFFSFFPVSSYFYNILFNRGRGKINTRFTCKLKLILFITWKVLQI